MSELANRHDCLLLDLDGTVFRGHVPTEGAVETLARIGCRSLFVTNNATRSAAEVADHLRELGFDAGPDDVVTSSQSAARMLWQRLPAGAAVLVLGTEALVGEISAVGLSPVRTVAEGPVAVVQGLSTTICWSDLAEAALAIRSGALWVASNLDATLPTEQGLLPGNGSLVAALRTATDAEPLVAGKPAPTLMFDALARGAFRAPLVVGDRLDTDIAGANAVGLPSLMVLTGVSSAREMVYAKPAERPTYLGQDLRSLLADAAELEVTAQPAWEVVVEGGAVTVRATRHPTGADGLSVVRAVARAIWDAETEGRHLPVRAADDLAEVALRRWSLGGDFPVSDPLS